MRVFMFLLYVIAYIRNKHMELLSILLKNSNTHIGRSLHWGNIKMLIWNELINRK